jgi:hypothetical protein
VSNILRQRLEAGQSAHTEHPRVDLLAAFVEHGLKGGERDKMLAHLAVCPECRQAVILAAPEVPERSQVAAARSPVLHFPAAMRWASLAAALAVAVGVGLISYEHDSSSRSAHTVSTLSKAAEAGNANEQKAPAKSGNTAALQDSYSTRATKSQLTEAKKSDSFDEKRTAFVAKDRKSNRPVVAAPALNTRVNEQPSSFAASQSPPQVQAGDVNFIAGTANKEKAFSQNELASAKSAPTPTAPPAPMIANAYADQTPQPAVPSDRMAARTANAPMSVSQTVTVESESVTVSAASEPITEAFTIPAKSGGSAAIGGSLMRKSGIAITEIVSWTVTAAGKLQRQLRNGAVKIVEPAPGVLVRAVAAQGIEVWAGGSQPDLKAKQWKQSPALFHSSDAGESWTKVSGPWHGPINQLILVAPDNLKVATEDGTWISRDAGKSWVTQ